MTTLTFNEIATLAVNQPKKSTKAQSFASLREVIGMLDIDQCDKNKALESIATIYSFFLPQVQAKPKTAESWVFKAVAKQEVRRYLNYAYSDGSFLFGCDGHRIHLCDTDKPAGYYDTNGSRVEISEKYPDYESIIKAAKGEHKLNPDGYSIKEFKLHGKPDIYADFDNGTRVNYEYLKAALSFGEPVSFKNKDDSSVILFEFGDSRKAFIMPIRK